MMIAFKIMQIFSGHPVLYALIELPLQNVINLIGPYCGWSARWCGEACSLRLATCRGSHVAKNTTRATLKSSEQPGAF